MGLAGVRLGWVGLGWAGLYSGRLCSDGSAMTTEILTNQQHKVLKSYNGGNPLIVTRTAQIHLQTSIFRIEGALQAHAC